MVPGSLARLGAGTFVSAVGNGAWYTSWALFLTRSVGLSPTQVGLGMTLAGVVGLLSGTPIGWVADRLGAREVFAALLVLQAAAALAYLAVGGLAAFVATACVAEAARSGNGARNALVLGLTPHEEDRLAALGSLRSISHFGWAIGAVAGAVIIGVDSRAAYVALLLVNAVSYLVYAALVTSVPRVAATPSRRGLRVVHDRPYISLAALMGVLALCWAMMSSGLPLWIALHTDAPRSLSAVIVVLNSLAIALLQVRVSRGIGSPAVAARGAVLSGGLLAASCLMFAVTAGWGGAGVIAMLVA
ncbi:MAG TPA: MFS transporter, partial [Solirubrobacteraceae bacterium]|nr:MFS transporter [Solirubrobacteraceae bacterium]